MAEVNPKVTFLVTGRVFDSTPTVTNEDGRKNIEYKNVVATERWRVPAKDFGQAEHWLISTHPDYYMGATIEQEGNEHAKMEIPRPGNRYYDDGEYESVENRRNYIKWACDLYGYKAGPAEYGAAKQRELIDAPSDVSTVYEEQYGA